MNTYQEIIKSIIQAQMNIIGPMAVEEANKVEGISVDFGLNNITITGDNAQLVQKLITQYSLLFGAISIEVSKEAIEKIMKNSKENIKLPAIIN
jgi:hypothetical protein